MAAHSASIRQSAAALGPGVMAAFSLGLGLTWLTYRHGRLLTFDGYYYCEFAKQFAHQWPDRFGLHWPFGYPLLGGLLARLGLAAYSSLVTVSAAALAVLLWLSSVIARPHSTVLPILAAIASAPVLTVELGGVLTELPFAATWLTLGFALGRWPNRASVWLAAGCCVLAVSIRYAGIISLGVVIAWVGLNAGPLRTARRLGEAILACGTAVIATGGLLLLNVVKSGYASGAPRGVSAGFRAFPAQLADFGWSMPSALTAGGVRDLVSPETVLGVAAGAGSTLLLLSLCLWSWSRPQSAFSRPLALLTFAYVTGMAALRCIGEFDALYNARTFLPVYAPVLLMVVERVRWQPAIILLGALLVGCGVLASARGISRQISGDVHEAITPLRARITPADSIVINDHAFALSAYFAEPVTRRLLPELRAGMKERFFVVAGKPHDRAGRNAECPADWAGFCAQLVREGRYRYLVHAPHLLVLERIVP